MKYIKEEIREKNYFVAPDFETVMDKLRTDAYVDQLIREEQTIQNEFDYEDSMKDRV